MKIQQNDWLVVQHEKAARLVFHEEDGRFILKDRTGVKNGDLGQAVEVNEDDVMANLGKAPRHDAGKVYGADVLPVYRTDTIEGLGPVYFMRKFKSKEERKAIIKAGNAAVEKLFEYKIMPGKDIVCFILPVRRSKLMLGSYHFFDSNKRPDELSLFAEEYNDKKQNFLTWAHELAHAVWFTRMTPEMRVDWLDAYQEHVTTAKYGDNTLKSILQGLTEIGHIGRYRRQADPDERELLAECLKYMSRVHSLDRHNVADILKAGAGLKKYWPTDPVLISKKNVIVSEYASTNPDEFFAETLSFYLVGAELPKSIRLLVKKTLKQAPHVLFEPANAKAKKEDGD